MATPAEIAAEIVDEWASVPIARNDLKAHIAAAIEAERATVVESIRMSEQRLPSQGSQSVTRQLMALLEQREARGIATYGRSLETFNGRDAPRDLVEELLDAAQYALQWQIERAELFIMLDRVKQERDTVWAELTRLTDVVENLKAKLTLHESEVAGRVATLTAALHLIAKTNRIPHPEHADVSLTAHSAAGHQRCQAIAVAALKIKETP